MNTKYEKLKIQTSNIVLLWSNINGIAPNSVVKKMDEAMLDWLLQLTECLSLWINKGKNLSNGELILAYTNLGSIIESWMKFFYCAYYEDYLKAPITRKGKIIEPNNMSLEPLKQFGIGILWTSNKDDNYKWLEKIQMRRNAIHAFNYKDIGSAQEFFNDVETFCDFVERVINKLPPLEDYIEHYPSGYVYI